MTIEDVLAERAERGTPRGADQVLADARRGTPRPLHLSEPDSPRDSKRWLAAVAAVALVAGGGVAAVRAFDPGNSGVVESAPADNEEPMADDVRGGVDPQVPLVVVDDPSFNVTSSLRDARIVVDQEFDEVFYDPDLLLDGPYLFLARDSERQGLEEGAEGVRAISIAGLPALVVERDGVAAVQVTIEGVRHLLVGLNVTVDQLQAAVEGLVSGGRPNLPAGVESIDRTGDVSDGELVGSEYEFVLDDLDGSVSVVSGTVDQFQSIIYEHSIGSTQRSGTVAGHSALLYSDSTTLVDSSTEVPETDAGTLVPSEVAVWWADGFIVEFRLNEATPERLEATLERITVADPDAWDDLLPETFVGIGDILLEVTAVVDDSPLPEGTTIESLSTDVAPGTKIFVAQQVTDQVVCGWADRWANSKAVNDNEQTTQAETAVSEWSRRMSETFLDDDPDWTEQLDRFAQKMTNGEDPRESGIVYFSC